MQIKSIFAAGALTIGLIAVGGAGTAVAGEMIDGGDVQNGSLTGSDVQNGSITDADIANGAVDGGEVQDGTITGSDIKNESLTGADIANGRIKSDDIADQSVSAVDLAPDVIAGLKADGDIDQNGKAVRSWNTGGLESSVPTSLVSLYVELPAGATSPQSVTIEGNLEGGVRGTLTCTAVPVADGGSGTCSATRVLTGDLVTTTAGNAPFEAVAVRVN